MKKLRTPSLFYALFFACVVSAPSGQVHAMRSTSLKTMVTFALTCFLVTGNQHGPYVQGEGALGRLDNYGFEGADFTFSDKVQMAEDIAFVEFDTINDALGGALGTFNFETVNVTQTMVNTTVANTTSQPVTTTTTTTTEVLDDDSEKFYETKEYIISVSVVGGSLLLLWASLFVSKRGLCGDTCVDRVNTCSDAVFGHCWNDIWCKILCCGCSCECCPEACVVNCSTCDKAWDCFTCGMCSSFFICCCTAMPLWCKQLFCCETCYEETIEADDDVELEIQKVQSEDAGTTME